MIKNYMRYLLISFVILISCQQSEVIEKIIFDYNQLSKIVISAKNKEINNIYEPKFNDIYIDHSLKISPLNHLNLFFNNNFSIIGSENKIVINILDASIKKSEIENTNTKKYKEKNIFFYEINFIADYILYDDNNLVLAKVKVESFRSTTSGKFISLIQSEAIIDRLILDCLIDFSNKSQELINKHMFNYVL